VLGDGTEWMEIWQFFDTWGAGSAARGTAAGHVQPGLPRITSVRSSRAKERSTTSRIAAVGVTWHFRAERFGITLKQIGYLAGVATHYEYQAASAGFYARLPIRPSTRKTRKITTKM
jgi:hypothetical protein